MKVLGVSQIFITAVPVLLMLVYASVMFLLRSQRVRMDQAGDNLYYLGFLYTLMSLAYSLYQFGTSPDAASKIIENFGIAIASTIMGLVFRVLFNQMRSDPAETEALARIELAEAARRMRGELDRSAIDFSAYRGALQQNITEAYESLHEDVSKTLKGAFATLDEDIEKVSKSTAAATETINGATERFRNRTDFFASEIETLSAKVAAVEVPPDILIQKIEPAVHAMMEAVSALKEASVNERAEAELRLKIMQEMQQAGESLKALIEASLTASEAAREAMQGLHPERQAFAATIREASTVPETQGVEETEAPGAAILSEDGQPEKPRS